MTAFEKARAFIYRNARPIDLARWQYHFENGTQEAVLNALGVYQNEDGGFGHALEPDSFNPDSTPIQTWAATAILKEIGFKDSDHPIIRGILRYLDSGADFSEEHNQWRNVVKSNNDHPHAIWWGFGEDGGEFKYNPTASLAGFAVRFAEKDSALYEKACRIVRQAYDWISENTSLEEMHIVRCFSEMYDHLAEANADMIDLTEFESRLKPLVNANICRDTEKWRTEYVSKPSSFLFSKSSIFYADNAELCKAECEFIRETQLEDGSYHVPWQWFTDYKEFEISANRWKSDFCIGNMRFLKEFSE